MKNIIISLLTVFVLLLFNSCQNDNYAEPSETLSGRIIDSTTGDNIVTTSMGISLKMWEISWSATPSPQSLNVKDDGTYNNTKLFAAKYKIIPTNGAFWPATDTTVVDINGGKTVQDFTVTPYLKLAITDYHLSGTTLTISGKIDAPIVDGLPQIIDIRPFVAITQYVGNANISNYSDPYKIDINKNFTDGVKDHIYTMTIRNLKASTTFYVRLGARVNDSFKNYNYSEVIKIDVPAADPNAIPDNYLKNADFPFVMATWDGDRWGTLTEWLTNDAMRNRGDGKYGGYDGGYGEFQGGKNSSFGFERWGSGENTITNGKIYQIMTLPVGDYEYTLSFAGGNPQASNNGSDPRFIIVAAGKTLPDVADLNTSLAQASFVGMDPNTGSVKVEFTLTQSTEVTVGVLANITNTEQNVRIHHLSLKKL